MSSTILDWLRCLASASIGGAAAIGVVWAVSKFAPRLSPAIRCWLWWLACLKLLLGLIALPALSLALLPTGDGQRLLRAIPPMPAVSARPAPRPGSHAANIVISPKVSPTAAAAEIWPLLVCGAWVAGVGVVIGGQFMALRQLRRSAVSGIPTENPMVYEAVKAAGLPHMPTLRITPSRIEPLTVAAFGRPLILIAQDDMERLSDRELLSLLTHECVHIRRGDILLALVPSVAQMLFWFLPPIHFAVHEFELSREAACDQATVAALSIAPRQYGELLLKLSSPESPLVRPGSAMALSAGFRQLKRRIEMLDHQPAPRFARITVAFAICTVAGVLVPWRFTARAATIDRPETAASPDDAPPTAIDPPKVSAGRGDTLPNLSFAQGLAHWAGQMSVNDLENPPRYVIGVGPSGTNTGAPSAFVQSVGKVGHDPQGSGGELCYNIPADRLGDYRGKRLRVSADVKVEKTTGDATIFIGAITSPKYHFSYSDHVRAGDGPGWRHLTCVTDVPADAASLGFGVGLQGEGTAFGSAFRVEVVDTSVALSQVQDVDVSVEDGNGGSIGNLAFDKGLSGWWTQNPGHPASTDKAVELLPHGGRTGGPAVLITTPTDETPGQPGIGIFQMADPGAYRGKRVRCTVYLKTDEQGAAALMAAPFSTKSNEAPPMDSFKDANSVEGQKEWTKVEYTFDIPKSNTTLMLGIFTGGGKVWVDGFKLEVVGPSQK